MHAKFPSYVKSKLTLSMSKNKENRVVKSHQEPLYGKPCQWETKNHRTKFNKISPLYIEK